VAKKEEAVAYEVRVERLHGKWTVVTEDGTVKLFETVKNARREAVKFIPDGTAIRACVFQRTLVESINCSGVHARRP
jgi:hypothetical protein